MPNTASGTGILGQMQEFYAQEYNRGMPMVVDSSFAEEITAPESAVIAVPRGSLRSIDPPTVNAGETISIPFLNGSNARIQADGEFIWTTETGENIPISKLEDSHLYNIIRMLSRNMVGEEKDSQTYIRNERTLILMREERDKRNDR